MQLLKPQQGADFPTYWYTQDWWGILGIEMEGELGMEQMTPADVLPFSTLEYVRWSLMGSIKLYEVAPPKKASRLGVG